MLQRIRDGLQGQKWLAWVVLGAIGATFVFWGGTNSLDFNGTSKNDAAKVDGDEIPAEQARQEWGRVQSQWAQQVGSDIPAEQAKKMQDNILDQLILQKLIKSRLHDQNYRVSNSKVLAEVQSIGAFKGADGKFDANQARAVLRQYNKTEEQFFEETRTQLVVNQLQQGIGGSFFLTPAESRRLYNLENEEREVQYVELPAEKFAGSAPIDDAAVKTYYDKNGDRFMTAEYVSLDYAELRLEQLATQVVPTEDDLKKLYEENRANYVLDEQRRTRHIVIPVQGDDDAGAKKQAEAVLAEARSGKDFAELAKKYSKDPSAADGGELGFVGRKDFAGPIGDTLFGMKVGDVAGPVKSQFGYHILKLEEIHAAEVKPFEAVRAELDSQYRTDRAAQLFSERQDAITEALDKGDDLDKLAQQLGLTHGSVAEFRRGGGAEPLGSGADLQAAVFSDATLNQGKIGGPVALGEDRLVLVKVTSHHKAEVKPLSVVHDEIVALLRHDRGVAAAKAAADGAVGKITGGEKLENLAKEWSVTADPAKFVSRGDPSIPAALRSAVFDAARPAEKAVVKSATLDDGAAVVFVVSRTRVADSSNPQMLQQANASLLQRSAGGDIVSYVNEAKRKAKIVKNPAVFE
ncbi:MAG TPA: SurA N-terminal domain-containing protein [Steroidobacteraceae bacterium]|nr:SurA N-terminal domain-containing protein [Steroidobacteraceae bacterium]